MRAEVTWIDRPAGDVRIGISRVQGPMVVYHRTDGRRVEVGTANRELNCEAESCGTSTS